MVPITECVGALRPKRSGIVCNLLIVLFWGISIGWAQQIPDTAFNYRAETLAYEIGEGPIIGIDAGHHNFHTAEGRFLPFAKLLRQDGYSVISLEAQKFNLNQLDSIQILVISNALNEQNIESWSLPNPSAFLKSEIELIQYWVHAGGRLLLIADHMPFAGATKELASVFGFNFINGFAFTDSIGTGKSIFIRNERLLNHSILKERIVVDTLVSFTGSAFSIPADAEGILQFTFSDTLLVPEVAWQFDSNTEFIPLNGYFQGAVLQYGKGKIAVFGEAAMFTAQIVNGIHKIGMNDEAAKQNAPFILNLMSWLVKD